MTFTDRLTFNAFFEVINATFSLSLTFTSCGAVLVYGATYSTVGSTMGEDRFCKTKHLTIMQYSHSSIFWWALGPYRNCEMHFLTATAALIFAAQRITNVNVIAIFTNAFLTVGSSELCSLTFPCFRRKLSSSEFIPEKKHIYLGVDEDKWVI